MARKRERYKPKSKSQAKPAADAPPLTRLAESAAPLKRGFERMLSGIEGALGIGQPADNRERAAEAVAKHKDPAPAATPRAEPAPRVVREPVAPPQPASSSGRKTIGGDSGPIQVNDVHGGGVDASVDHEDLQVAASLQVDAWYDQLEDAAAKLTLLEVQADPQTEAELTALLAALEAQKAGLDLAPKRTNQLIDLQWRFKGYLRRKR